MVSAIIGHIGTSFAAANSIVAMIQRLCTVMNQRAGQTAQMLTGVPVPIPKLEMDTRSMNQTGGEHDEKRLFVGRSFSSSSSRRSL